jgi:small glutamine-rich tetratricopeptide repeat-containing protein alpha
LLAEREQLEAAIRQGQGRLVELRASEVKARAEISELEKQAATLRAELKGAREATPVLIEAINAFHRKNYKLAIARYEQALRLNPGDSYIYNLMSYSQFKSGDLAGAIKTLSQSLKLDPSYDWGYFDLARYQCAAGMPGDALETIRRAAEARGTSIRRMTSFFLSEDGEFRRLCASVLPQLRALAQ